MMLGGTTIITTAIVSWIFLGRRIHRHHAVGLISSFIGFCLVGYSSIIGSEGDTHNGTVTGTIIGIIMIVMSVFIGAFISNFQEYLFRTYELPVQREIGLEGHFGLIWILIELVIFSFIPCFQKGLCKVFQKG